MPSAGPIFFWGGGGRAGLHAVQLYRFRRLQFGKYELAVFSGLHFFLLCLFLDQELEPLPKNVHLSLADPDLEAWVAVQLPQTHF